MTGPVDGSKSCLIQQGFSCDDIEGSGYGSGSSDLDITVTIDEGSGEGSGIPVIDDKTNEEILGRVSKAEITQKTFERSSVTTSETTMVILTSTESNMDNVDDYEDLLMTTKKHTTLPPIDLDNQPSSIDNSTTINHSSEENFTTLAPVIHGTSDDNDPSYLTFTTDSPIETIETPTTESSIPTIQPVFNVMYHEDLSNKVHDVVYYSKKSKNSDVRGKAAPKAGKSNKKKAKKLKKRKNQSFEVQTTIDPFADTVNVDASKADDMDIEIVDFKFNVTDFDALETTVGPM